MLSLCHRCFVTVCTIYRWASLNESVVFIDAVKEGEAVGYISSAISYNGDTADLNLQAIALDGNDKQQLATHNSLQWSSPSQLWTDSGKISVFSDFNVVNTVNWDAFGLFDYGNSLYNLTVSDKYASGAPLFYAQGNGAYGGSWTKW